MNTNATYQRLIATVAAATRRVCPHARKPQVPVSRGSAGSMNRSVYRAMVGVAGLAVLGMTATLAGAQTDEVKEKPALAAAAHPAAFTLNEVMQAPFASNILAPATGAAAAWGFTSTCCRNNR